jgi:large subunit ribosomal protein L24
MSIKQPKSKKPRKQRKFRLEAPFHKRHKMIAAHLSKELREKYKRRSLPVRKGDKVKIMRGSFKGTSGEVTEVNLKTYKIYVDGINIKKASGEDVPKALDPSNVMITSLFLEDKERRDVLDRKVG